jgi:hypothetical protein
MPKINLPELEHLAEYLTGKVPRYGMFSTLKGLIDNSPREAMTAQEWAGYLKPGQIASRAGVDFPLKKEELDYSKIVPYLQTLKPNQKVSRADILQLYMQNAPNLNVQLGSDLAQAGTTREQRQLAQAGVSTTGAGGQRRVTAGSPQYSEYSHAERGDSGPGNPASPYGAKAYQLDVTRSPDFGQYQSHFSDRDISWNRSNRLPLWGESTGMGATGTPEGRTMRVIDEIQSDRHQKAIKPGGWAPTPENLTRMQDLAQDLMTNMFDDREGFQAGPWARDVITDALRFGTEGARGGNILAEDPRWQELQKLREASKATKVGYQTPADLARIREIEGMELFREPNAVMRRAQTPYFDQEGNLQFNTDPNLQARLNALKNEVARLRAKIPDTPFKTTQGFVGLEMRKALADAAHTGDMGLGLASGNDQNAFYGRRFSADQATGQNYNYNISYPSVLKDLAQRFQLPYRPMDVTLHAKPEPNLNWPPRPFTREIGDFRGQELADVPDWAHPTLDNYIRQVLNAEGDEWNRYEVPGKYERLWQHMVDKVPVEKREEMGLGAFNPETGEDVPAAEGTMEDKFYKAIADMRKHAKEINDVEMQYRPRESGHYDEEDNWVEDEPKNQQAWADMQRSRAYQNMHYNWEQASREAGESMRPLWDWYEQTYKAPPEQNPLRKKTFENAIDMTNPDDLARVKAAGVPVWKHGGPVDHLRHALHHLGYSTDYLVSREDERQQHGMAGGGEVKTAVNLSELIEHFLERYHDFMRTPVGEIQDADAAHIRQVGNQLQQSGINPEDLIYDRMAAAGKTPAVTEHAEGGSTTGDQPSLENVLVESERQVPGEEQEAHKELLKKMQEYMLAQASEEEQKPTYTSNPMTRKHFQEGGPSLSDLITGPTIKGNEGIPANYQPDYESSLTALRNRVQRSIAEREAEAAAEMKAAGTDPAKYDDPDNPPGELAARAVTSLAKQVYGTDPQGHLVAGGDILHPGPGSTPPLILDRLYSTPHALARLFEGYATLPARLLGANLGDESKGHPISSMMPGSKAAGERAEALEGKIQRSVGLPPAHTFKQHFFEEAPSAVIPIPGLPAEGAGSHLMGWLGASPLRSWPAMATEWGSLNALIGSAGDALDRLRGGGGGGRMRPEQMIEHARHQGPDPNSVEPEDTSVGKDIQKEIGDEAYQRHLRGLDEGQTVHFPGGSPVTAGMAEGGQTPPPETEENFLDQLLQRRMFMGQSAPPPRMAGGGEIGLAERLAQLWEKLTSSPEMKAHAADVLNRGWATEAKPQDIFTQVAETSPEMAEHAKDIQSRNWTSIYDKPPGQARGGHFKHMYGSPALYTTVPGTSGVDDGGGGGMAEGGGIDWEATRNRLHTLQHPTIGGQPGEPPPPAEPAMSDDEIETQQRADAHRDLLERLKELIGKHENYFGPSAPIHFTSDDVAEAQEEMEAPLGREIAMQAMGRMTNRDLGRMQKEYQPQPEDEEPAMAQGGPARGLLRGRRRGKRS